MVHRGRGWAGIVPVVVDEDSNFVCCVVAMATSVNADEDVRNETCESLCIAWHFCRVKKKNNHKKIEKKTKNKKLEKLEKLEKLKNLKNWKN